LVEVKDVFFHPVIPVGLASTVRQEKGGGGIQIGKEFFKRKLVNSKIT
jgi:hypothetical protein